MKSCFLKKVIFHLIFLVYISLLVLPHSVFAQTNKIFNELSLDFDKKVLSGELNANFVGKNVDIKLGDTKLNTLQSSSSRFSISLDVDDDTFMFLRATPLKAYYKIIERTGVIRDYTHILTFTSGAGNNYTVPIVNLIPNYNYKDYKVISDSDNGDGGDNVDLDLPEVIITSVDAREGASEAIFNLTLKGARGPFVVNFKTEDDPSQTSAAAAGIDYVSTSGNVNFSGKDGEIQQIKIPLIDDDIVENMEVIFVIFSSSDLPIKHPRRGVRIIDNDQLTGTDSLDIRLNLMLDLERKSLRGVIADSKIEKTATVVELYNPVTGSRLRARDIPKGNPDFSINLNSLNVVFDETKKIFTSADNQEYTHFRFTNPAILEKDQNVLISQIHIKDQNGDTGSDVDIFVDFPGWVDAEYQKIPGKNTYYPYVKSGFLKRTPASADLYLILENTTTGQKTLLAPYAGGAQSFSITWPAKPETLKTSNLIPGQDYTVYLSSTIDGSSGPVSTTGEPTRYSLGQVPSAGAIMITGVTFNDTDDGKTLLQVQANAAVDFSGSVDFKIIGSENSNETITVDLGSVVNPKNNFVFPQKPESYALGGFSSYVVQARVNNEVISEFLIEKKPTDDSDNTGDPAGDTDSDVSNSGPSLNNTQKDIIANGVVDTSCGYNLDKGGRICGFADAIVLIQRIIEYIFILVLPITAIVFAYAGYLYLTSGGDTNKRNAAKQAMTNVLIGVVVVMSAWLIVRTVVGALGVDTDASWFYLAK